MDCPEWLDPPDIACHTENTMTEKIDSSQEKVSRLMRLRMRVSQDVGKSLQNFIRSDIPNVPLANKLAEQAFFIFGRSTKPLEEKPDNLHDDLSDSTREWRKVVMYQHYLTTINNQKFALRSEVGAKNVNPSGLLLSFIISPNQSQSDVLLRPPYYEQSKERRDFEMYQIIPSEFLVAEPEREIALAGLMAVLGNKEEEGVDYAKVDAPRSAHALMPMQIMVRHALKPKIHLLEQDSEARQAVVLQDDDLSSEEAS